MKRERTAVSRPGVMVAVTADSIQLRGRAEESHSALVRPAGSREAVVAGVSPAVAPRRSPATAAVGAKRPPDSGGRLSLVFPSHVKWPRRLVSGGAPIIGPVPGRLWRSRAFRRSSVVERAAVNRLVVGSSPTAGATHFPSSDRSIAVAARVRLVPSPAAGRRRPGLSWPCVLAPRRGSPRPLSESRPVARTAGCGRPAR